MKRVELVPLSVAIRSGQDLEPMNPWPAEMERTPTVAHAQGTWFDGQEITALVYEAEDGMIHFTDLPYDEFVFVLNGTAVLTTDGGEPQEFHTGDSFVAPRGWTGTWEFRKTYRELIVFEKKSLAAAVEKWKLI